MHTQILPTWITPTWELLSYPDLLHPASGVMTLFWVKHWLSGGFSFPHKPSTDDMQKALSASELSASVPEQRFSTRVWGTCCDAQADRGQICGRPCRLTQILWISKEGNLKKNRLVVIAKQPQEKERELVTPFGSKLGFYMSANQTLRWYIQHNKPVWQLQFFFMATGHTTSTSCCVKHCFRIFEILLSVSQDWFPSARRLRQLSLKSPLWNT